MATHILRSGIFVAVLRNTAFYLIHECGVSERHESHALGAVHYLYHLFREGLEPLLPFPFVLQNYICLDTPSFPQAQKMDKVEMAGSLVAQCWSSFVDESEKIVKIVKENADFLATNTLEILNSLFLEKRNNRKTYHEEHARVCGELHKLQVFGLCGPRC